MEVCKKYPIAVTVPRKLLALSKSTVAVLAHCIFACCLFGFRLFVGLTGLSLTILYAWATFCCGLYLVEPYIRQVLPAVYFLSGLLCMWLFFHPEHLYWFQHRGEREKRRNLENVNDGVCDDRVYFSGDDRRIKIIDTPWWVLPFSLLCAPGFFALIPMALLVWCSQLSCSCPAEFVMGFSIMFPILASYKTFLRLTKRYYRIDIGPLGIRVLSGAKKEQSIHWSNISALRVTKLNRVTESQYHADDLDQQQVMLVDDGGSAVSIGLDTLTQRQRVDLARVLRKHVNSKAFSDSALNFFKCCGLESVEKAIENAPQVEAGTSFTEMWEQDIRRHIGRTNYVPLEVGAELQDGRVKIKSYLSSGGFSTTYLASRRSLDTEEIVVIKESSLPQCLNDEAKQKISDMFSREARLLQKCDHPRIAKVLDCFQENGREYLALEYLNGVRLSDVIKADSIASEEQCIKWAIELAELLKYLHGMEPPIIHRDFTPDNIILRASGNLNLIDFGAANEFLGGATGTLVGKQSYIAPEQFQGKATTQSDIYAFGATLYFILTAQEPLPLSESHPRSVRPEISQDLDLLISRCTGLDTTMRIDSAAEILQKLNRLKENR